ncbi:MAG: hypothetical protein H6843_15160 [Rhodospirillaceae bacterium]|nr:hypothetical protein [Rhodospirillaceae bacterium]
MTHPIAKACMAAGMAAGMAVCLAAVLLTGCGDATTCSTTVSGTGVLHRPGYCLHAPSIPRPGG